jgi:assimilatory nitrate reductase catalytic subunit
MFRAWSSPEAAFQILKELSRDRPCDFSGIRDYAHIDEQRGIQWPWTEADDAAARSPGGLAADLGGAARRHRRLFADGEFFTADGRARFFFDRPRPMAELPDDEYPFLLLTGRGSSAQWHTGSRTNKSAVLRKLAPTELYAEINPVDAEKLGINAGEVVNVCSRRSRITALAFITSTVQPGQVFLPMHFSTVNQLTFPSYDPHSRQPSYKAAAVQIERVRR